MNWPPYPEYKKAGIDWLDSVPARWEVTKLAWHTTCSSGEFLPNDRMSRVEDEQFNVPVIGGNGTMGFTDASNTKAEVLAVGRVGALCGNVHRVSPPAWITDNALRIGIRSGLDAHYLRLVLQTRNLNDLATKTAQPLITGTQVSNERVPAPELSEQHRIVAFLDRETAKIDALIGKQEQLIATLREDRHAQLIKLVAHGCDPATALKPCNLGWVEAVPRHWDVVNIRRIALMKTGHTPSRTVADYWENTTIPWFTLADVWQLRDGLTTYLGETKDRISEMGLANSAAELLPAGTVVLSRTASVGFTGIMPAPMATSQDFWNWVCGPQILPEYLMYTFRAMQSYFSALMMGSTHQTIYQADAAAIRIPLPPLSEQQQIVGQVVSKTGAIDELIAKAVQMIGVLREYRSALITDAVTGKIDVRGAA